MKGPTDTQRLWTELHRAGKSGIHSFDIRAHLGMGNPSQRVSEIEDDHDCTVPRRRERRNGRMGVRYFHPDHAPAGLGDGVTPAPVAEPSRESRSGPAAEGRPDPDHLPSANETRPDAAGPDRSLDNVEQLGLIPTPPAIYDDAA